MQSRPGHARNFKLISKFSYMRPVFPDYLSVSYDYAEKYSKHSLIKHTYTWRVNLLYQILLFLLKQQLSFLKFSISKWNKKSNIISRSSNLKCSVRKGVLRNFAKFTGRDRAGVSFSIKLQASFSQNTYGRLLLNFNKNIKRNLC